MKILASLTLQADSTVTLPTATPLTIPTAGFKPKPGQHIIQGELVKVAGKLTLLILTASPAAGMVEFVQCAGLADASGNIEKAGLSCDMSGPFCGALVEIKGRRAYFMAAHSAGVASPEPEKPRKAEKAAPSVKAPLVEPSPSPAAVPAVEAAEMPSLVEPEAAPEPEPVVPVVVAPAVDLDPTPAVDPEPVAVVPEVVEIATIPEPEAPIAAPVAFPAFEILSKPIDQPFPVETDPVPGLVSCIVASKAKSAPEPKSAPKRAAAIKPTPAQIFGVEPTAAPLPVRVAEVKPAEACVPVLTVSEPSGTKSQVNRGTQQLSMTGIINGEDVEVY